MIYKPVCLSKGWVKTSFYHNDTFYNIPVKLPKGPVELEVKKIVGLSARKEWNDDCSENKEDVTSQVLSLMGPNLDFYKLEITPNILGYKYLEFTTDGKTWIFQGNEKMRFN